jgi:DNA repair exonuclease SbcCD ATPase subunit
MAHAGMGDLRQRMADLYQEAIASEHRLEDVIPSEIQEYFRDVTASESDLSRQNKELQDEVKELRKAVETERNKNDNISTAYERDTLMENKLIRDQLEYAEQKADNYRRKLDEAIARQQVVDDTAKKLTNLRGELEGYKKSLVKYLEENRYLHGLCDELAEQQKDTLRQKDEEIEDMYGYIKDVEDQRNLLEEQTGNIEEIYKALEADIEAVNSDCASKLTMAAARQRTLEKLNNATISEIRALRQFFQIGISSLACFKAFFQQLLECHTNSGQAIPQELMDALNRADEERETWSTIREAVEQEDFEESIIREELKAMGTSACELLNTMKDMAAEYDAFLEVLYQYPRA